MRVDFELVLRRPIETALVVGRSGNRCLGLVFRGASDNPELGIRNLYDGRDIYVLISRFKIFLLASH